MSDAIDEAIKRTNGKQTVRMQRADLKLPSGLPAQVALPEGCTALDALSLCRIVIEMYDRMQQQRPASRLVLPQ